MCHFLLIVSLLVQCSAAALAIHLIATTRRRLAWVLIACAIGLMAIRRSITLWRLFAGTGTADAAAELVALAISLLMLAGIASIGPMFRSITRDRERLMKWQYVMMQAGWGVATADPATRTFDLVNPAFARMHGYTVDELMGKPIDTVYAPDLRGTAGEHVAAAEQTDLRIETVHERKDGSTFPVEKIVSTMRDESGEVLFVAAHVEDITERKRAELALKERDTRLQLLEEEIPTVMWSTNMDLVITSGSGGGLKNLGVERDQLKGVRLQDYLQSEDPDFLPIRAHRRAAAGESMVYDWEWQGRAFHTWLEPLRDGTGEITGVFGIAIDLTERKEAETALRESHAMLRRLTGRLQEVREEERTAIAREIHDEIGQAMTGLKLELAWLRDNFPREDTELRDRAGAMIEMVEGTIETARRLSKRLRPAVLDELGLEAALESLARELEERTGCTCSFAFEAGDLGFSERRDTAVFRIVQEALTNVARHAGAKRVEIRLSAREGELMVEVADDGRGIADSELHAGRSLGLVGMRERAHALGGEVTFRRRDQGGTVVTLRLPVRPVRLEEEAKAP